MSFGFGSANPGLNVEVVCVGYEAGTLKVALLKRSADPYRGRLALPAVGLRLNERLSQGAARALKEKLDVSTQSLARIGIFDQPDRDPRERVISVAYLACVRIGMVTLPAGAEWVEAGAIAEGEVSRRFGFDHENIAQAGLRALARLSHEDLIPFQLLDARFSLTQVQRLYERIRGEGLDKRNFRRKLASYGILKDTGRLQNDVPHRAAKLYSLDARKVARLQASGEAFSL